MPGFRDRSGETPVTLWWTHGMEERVREVLHAVHLNSDQAHALGRPFVSSYQRAILIDELDPNLKAVIGKEVGGSGTGAHHSLAQYLGKELTRQIRADGEAHFVEGAFMSNERVRSIIHEGANGADVVSSVAGTANDITLFRLRRPS